MEDDVARELEDAGVPPEKAANLAELAREIEALPPVEPRAEWSARTKRQLLEQFDQQAANRCSEKDGEAPE